MVEDGQGAVNGPHNIQVLFFDAPSAGVQVCQSAPTPVTLTNGRFSVLLPEPCSAAVKASPNLWINVIVDGSDTGRAKIGAVPYALEASHALAATSATVVDVNAEPLKSALAGKANNAPVAEWTSYMPTLSLQTGTATTSDPVGRYRKIGDMLEARVSIAITNAIVNPGQVIFGCCPGSR